MAVTAQAGVLAFGPQASKDVVAPSFYRHKAVDVDLAIQDDVRLGQLEVGGVPTPTFPYKAGYMVGGGGTIQPRLEDTFGWLLYGALGKCTSAAAGGTVAAYDHTFEMSPDATSVPWMSARKYIPPLNGDLSTDLGEEYTNMKVLGLAFQMGADTPLTARMDMMGTDFTLTDSADAWAYANTYEDWESIPVACQTAGFIKIDTVELPVVQASFRWENAPLDIRQEKVIGSPKLEDITILTRRLAYDFVVKYNDPQLYRKVLTNSPTGLTWSGVPYTGSFEVKTVSSVNMPSEAEPFSLIAQADSANMQMVGGITLGAGQAIMMRFQGVALDAGGAQYAKFVLRNRKASYAWPT